jgi:feruloyl esterase
VGKDGKPILTRADLERVHDAVVAKCDMDDGVKDGVIGDPLHCKFDPAELLCKPGQTTGCLTGAQVEAVKKVYAGPMTSKGEKIYTGGPLPGSELNWIGEGGPDPYVSSSGGCIADEFFRYIGFVPAPGPGWKFTDFDFDRDYKRLGVAEALIGAANNPDLRKFKAAGGKLIVYQGWQDQSDIPEDAIDYYEAAEKVLGGRVPTQDFFRLFMVPGMDHCTGGAGAFAIDYLSYLEAWVEHGQAPDVMIGAHVQGVDWGGALGLKFPLDPAIPVSFTRPVYPYPLHAKYKGAGDPNDAGNFEPAEPTDTSSAVWK